MASNEKNIGILFPSGLTVHSEEEKKERLLFFQQEGLTPTIFYPELSSPSGCTAGPVVERASYLAQALTRRDLPLLWAGSGGFGSTELIPYLEHMLPPVLPPKTLIGFSDVSFLGVYLSCRHPHFDYIHSHVAMGKTPLTRVPEEDKSILLDFLNKRISEQEYACASSDSLPENGLKGECIPLNLSLAESMAALKHVSFENPHILFLEDCNEFLFRILRKVDSLLNSGLATHTLAVVVGNFNDCMDKENVPLNREKLIKLFRQKFGCPIVDFPLFGHTTRCLPLLALGEIAVFQNKIKFINKKKEIPCISSSFPKNLYLSHLKNKGTKVHLTGIGGSGMAQVAGLLQYAGFVVTGSDNPIYPPMDQVIRNLNIKPDVGFLQENLAKHNPDMIVLANVVSRTSASLQKNRELEAILAGQTPIFSFPSALRKFFLAKSTNLVVSGTHGKTTTSSFLTYVLTRLNWNPSFLIGGQPAHFDAGYALRSRDLFVLEGDEYDSAFFDKGPKFLHYEPSVSLLNNIEFDHADIYKNVEAIEQEFLNLALLTRDRGGIVVANVDDPRVLRVAQHSGARCLGFSKQKDFPIGKREFSFPVWKLLHYKTHATGIHVQIESPCGQPFDYDLSLFGEHNALNSLAVIVSIFAFYLFRKKEETEQSLLQSMVPILKEFKGVKRRFELLTHKNQISVFDDFAHHPTAVETTLRAFRDYMVASHREKGRLVVCFDPRNATMRRNILQKELGRSLSLADKIYLGTVPQDLRMNREDVLNGDTVAIEIGEKCQYFGDNKKLMENLKKDISAGDTVVFMSSGSFDGLPYEFAQFVNEII